MKETAITKWGLDTVDNEITRPGTKKSISLLDKFVLTEEGQGYVEANAYSKTLQTNQKFYKKMFACPQELKDEMDKYITGSQNRAIAGLLKFALDELKKQKKDLILY